MLVGVGFSSGCIGWLISIDFVLFIFYMLACLLACLLPKAIHSMGKG